eukprot:scaffold2456_cov238-Pinguiococcus_pyrenoidosus.AAC.6
MPSKTTAGRPGRTLPALARPSFSTMGMPSASIAMRSSTWERQSLFSAVRPRSSASASTLLSPGPSKPRMFPMAESRCTPKLAVGGRPRRRMTCAASPRTTCAVRELAYSATREGSDGAFQPQGQRPGHGALRAGRPEVCKAMLRQEGQERRPPRGYGSVERDEETPAAVPAVEIAKAAVLVSDALECCPVLYDVEDDAAVRIHAVRASVLWAV